MLQFRRPTLIPTLFTIPTLILLLALGTWQLQRLEWKNALIRDIGRAIHAGTIALPTAIPNPSDLQYRKIRVQGRFHHDKEIHLYTGTREYRGNQGYDILTPLERENGSTVLVDRGWVPIERKKPETRKETLIPGVVTIEGYVLLGEQKKFFTPVNEPGKNLWFWIDIPAINDTIKLNIAPFYILGAASKNPQSLPQGRDLTVNIRNDHLQYALTWYSAALALAVIYLLYHRKNP